MNPKQSAVKVANLERLKQMLIDIADANGVVRGCSLYTLTAEFNTRYMKEMKAVSSATLRNYIHTAAAGGWLVYEQESAILGRLVLTLVPADEV